ncbi:predicted protein [Sclerotinia sclerotiorum 1980 UF-70]|uniref:Uncharacterized protein n=1 Tax=Sclerotinia sclerotiorum (strain ATCC 18683 / 1980 / Ss-1) TaxID=665079 RepID=A7EBJ5_SCLS1|nr:predicted protein [Sclerotinia sclerotiorum 1980 UF-70]EDN99823.1 predicted protein [Sclerotinia sclerotiorum 1980 UF-70]
MAPHVLKFVYMARLLAATLPHRYMYPFIDACMPLYDLCLVVLLDKQPPQTRYYLLMYAALLADQCTVESTYCGFEESKRARSYGDFGIRINSLGSVQQRERGLFMVLSTVIKMAVESR